MGRCGWLDISDADKWATSMVATLLLKLVKLASMSAEDPLLSSANGNFEADRNNRSSKRLDRRLGSRFSVLVFAFFRNSSALAIGLRTETSVSVESKDLFRLSGISSSPSSVELFRSTSYSSGVTGVEGYDAESNLFVGVERCMSPGDPGTLRGVTGDAGVPEARRPTLGLLEGEGEGVLWTVCRGGPNPPAGDSTPIVAGI
mmetsp:Transcript_1497/g.3158  ORF Transcript_1497/g.3158 Transcript_1497/m.3158 type:complete len:202 (+) Transcript_1497:371-976(+)